MFTYRFDKVDSICLCQILERLELFFNRFVAFFPFRFCTAFKHTDVYSNFCSNVYKFLHSICVKIEYIISGALDVYSQVFYTFSKIFTKNIFFLDISRYVSQINAECAVTRSLLPQDDPGKVLLNGVWKLQTLQHVVDAF